MAWGVIDSIVMDLNISNMNPKNLRRYEETACNDSILKWNHKAGRQYEKKADNEYLALTRLSSGIAKAGEIL